jgi:DNA-directed RNA polymerase subunit K/omega
MEDPPFEEKNSDSEDEEYEQEVVNDILGDGDIDINEFYKTYATKRKNFKTSPVLSKYEKTRIISERVQQLSNGGIPFISNPESYSSIYDIALKELDMKKLPFIIKRKISGNNCELWKLEDLKIIN